MCTLRCSGHLDSPTILVELGPDPHLVSGLTYVTRFVTAAFTCVISNCTPLLLYYIRCLWRSGCATRARCKMPRLMLSLAHLLCFVGQVPVHERLKPVERLLRVRVPTGHPWAAFQCSPAWVVTSQALGHICCRYLV